MEEFSVSICECTLRCVHACHGRMKMMILSMKMVTFLLLLKKVVSTSLAKRERNKRKPGLNNG